MQLFWPCIIYLFFNNIIQLNISLNYILPNSILIFNHSGKLNIHQLLLPTLTISIIEYQQFIIKQNPLIKPLYVILDPHIAVKEFLVDSKIDS